MDYESPPPDNTDYGHARWWSMMFRCRCGHDALIGTESRYLRKTCRKCGTVWEIAPSVCDATPYDAEEAAQKDEPPPQSDDMYVLHMMVQGIAEKLDKFRWDFDHHTHHIHNEQIGTLGPRVPDLATYYMTDEGPTPKE